MYVGDTMVCCWLAGCIVLLQCRCGACGSAWRHGQGQMFASVPHPVGMRTCQEWHRLTAGASTAELWPTASSRSPHHLQKMYDHVVVRGMATKDGSTRSQPCSMGALNDTAHLTTNYIKQRTLGKCLRDAHHRYTCSIGRRRQPPPVCAAVPAGLPHT
jgi:hypothetical protein